MWRGGPEKKWSTSKKFPIIVSPAKEILDYAFSEENRQKHEKSKKRLGRHLKQPGHCKKRGTVGVGRIKDSWRPVKIWGEKTNESKGISPVKKDHGGGRGTNKLNGG